LKGKKSLTIYYNQSKVFNEEQIQKEKIEPLGETINFQRSYDDELESFDKHLDELKSEELTLRFYNDKVDRSVNNILDYIDSKKLYQLHPKLIVLKDLLLSLKDRCGSTTERAVRKIYSEIRKGQINESRINSWIDNIEKSCTIREIQQTLHSDPSRKLIIAFMEE
jgi:benzoyl-CoA reductase/2-hydroxyglutaryl-CoA dehydratase subunit BcrC/BadD/HgdB